MRLNHLINHVSARDDGPAGRALACAQRVGLGNTRAALACEPPRKRVAEKRVGPLAFDGAVEGHQTRGVRNVANETVVRRRRCGFRGSAGAIGELHARSFMYANPIAEVFSLSRQTGGLYTRLR